MTLRSFLDQQGVRYQWLHHDTAYTAQDLAQREHMSGKKVVKPVLIEADGRFVLCALSAAYHVDLERIREELNAEEARLADELTLAQLCPECEIGAEPPIGALFGIPTMMDESLSDEPEVLFQAGTHQDAVKMPFSDYIRIARPTVARFSRV
jgi:Ala-tRNA(Pro) deacylase